MEGVIEPVMVHFEDLDAMGVVHNGRYVLLLERARGVLDPGRLGL